MCLYPKLIRNRKYLVNNKNKGNVPEMKDHRVSMVPVGCGKCMECRKQNARQWQVRLHEQIRNKEPATFVTLTFSNESIIELLKDIPPSEGYALDNELATLATRRFLERWRKKYKTSVKHWLVTELGHNGSENIHLHGIIWSNKTEEIKKIWHYGFTYIGDYVNETTVNYIIKYITKTDLKHKEYKPKILTSPGIGSGYTQRHDATQNKYNGTKTRETYQTRNGTKINLPIYYRNKIYSEEEREQLWLQKLDKQERWICGTKIKTDTQQGLDAYYRMLKHYREKNKRLNYGDDEINWQQIHYENQKRQINIEKRIAKQIKNQ